MKIALTYTGSTEKHDNYLKWLKRDDDIELITLSVEEDNSSKLSECDGLVLSGGADISPAIYKSKKVIYPNAPKEFKKQRDDFEIAVFHLSQKNKIPVLGVCRGLQLINCILGGNLRQDLGKNLNNIHKFDKNDKAHGVNITENSLLHEITGIPRGVINSAHHQAVRKIGKGLKVNCISDDGTIEGLERSDKDGKPFLLCIQWHPERMYKFHLEDSPLSKAIRDRFLEEIKKSLV